MYEDILKRIRPKPKFNLEWYKDEDFYSEGDIEDTLIRLIAESEPEEYERIILDNYCWSTFYHLTHLRQNLLNWYPFQMDSSILEIGCGLGALTNMFCEKCHDVTAVELSKKRATATLLRCRERDNLEIIVGNLNDILFDKKFDYITLIGVLEYQGTYTQKDNPYLDFLCTIRNLLKPDGKLIIGIENKYGLKYWCGAKEDHTGVAFDGINQYIMKNKKVQTFSKSELKDLIQQSGFANTFFYYPMPDYKIPTVIYSENKLPDDENMQNMNPYYIPDKTTIIADEKKIYKDVIENEVFEFFSNSFLVECSNDKNIGKVIFCNLSSERLEEYRIMTTFTTDGLVQKRAINEKKGRQHILQIAENQENMEKMGVKLLPWVCSNDVLISKKSNEKLLQEILKQAFLCKSEREIFKNFDIIYEEILRSSDEANSESNIIFELNIDKVQNRNKYGSILRTGYIDMIARNAFCVDNQIYWFDQEWVMENVPAKFILYRAVMEFYYSYPWARSVISIDKIMIKYQMIDVISNFQMLEKSFSLVVASPVHSELCKYIRSDASSDIITNLIRLIDKKSTK